jgi:hypothetical protein
VFHLLASSSALGAKVQTNRTHSHFSILGEARAVGVAGALEMRNATHRNVAGFVAANPK